MVVMSHTKTENSYYEQWSIPAYRTETNDNIYKYEKLCPRLTTNVDRAVVLSLCCRY